MTARTILTKNGSKMAFVAIEDKTGESELIVFPKVLESLGDQLIQDAVVRVKGKISATDKDGNINGEIKIIADEITIVTNDELDNYQKTGKIMKAPKKRAAQPEPEPQKREAVTYKPIEDKPAQKIYVHITDPNDQDTLLRLKKLFNNYAGSSEIILVLGEDKSSAIRLPFTAEPSPELEAAIGELYGADYVKFV
jgi:DNA polymerase-3 subunit alpha